MALRVLSRQPFGPKKRTTHFINPAEGIAIRADIFIERDSRSDERDGSVDEHDGKSDERGGRSLEADEQFMT